MISRNGVFLVAFLGFFSGVYSADMKCPGVANYELSFVAMWSNETHPNAYPDGGDFSPWIGASHNMYYIMWADAMLASPGVEAVAETGNTATLKVEINERITYNKTAWMVIEQTPGEEPTGIPVQVTADYPLVSLLSMLVPSPDWFIGIKDINLCDGGMWRDSMEINPLLPWDAGTEDGDMFNTTNNATDPVQNISRITKSTMGTPFMGPNNIATLGTLTFTRVNKPVMYTCSGEQKYKLEFEGMWSNARQPVTTFPPGAHFSPLIGCTHKYNYKFWSPMTMASQGVQHVAETVLVTLVSPALWRFRVSLAGNATTLYDEITAVKNKAGDGYVFSVFKADDKTEPTATRTEIITAKEKYTKVSFIAMIAPSPDWFVGVDSVELCGSDGKWVESVAAKLLPAWDAGTDSGTMFQSADDIKTMPQDVVRQITKDSDTELNGATDINPFAKVTFTKYTDAAHSISGGISICLSVAFLAILRFLY